jgi:hypothetical protein
MAIMTQALAPLRLRTNISLAFHISSISKLVWPAQKIKGGWDNAIVERS